MANFADVSSTVATLNPGFSYSAYASQIDAAGDSLLDAVDTISSFMPSSQSIGSTSAHLVWFDGTTVDAVVSSLTNTSASLSSLELEAADGAFLEAKGSAKVTLSSSGMDLTGVKLREIDYGNTQAAQILLGSATVNADTGAVSGKLSSVVLAWHADNPATGGDEWLYVKLNGSVALSGDLSNGLGNLSGKVSSFEWGTLTDNGGTVSYSPVRVISGVKMDASHILSDLQGTGFDSLMAGLYSGNDKIDGTSGNDYLDASTGNDKVYGEGGDDDIFGGSGNDQLFGGAGNDVIRGGAGNDKIVDEEGNNYIYDLEGNNNVIVGNGDDQVLTYAGNDKIVAGDGKNYIATGDGNDNVIAGSGRDDIVTGDGNDKVTAGDGNNEIYSGQGNDKVVCGGGNDFIYADDGNDKIVAGAGNDWIIGSAGADNIAGGLGRDVFVFENLAVGGIDNIADFNVADDKLLFMDVFTSLSGGVSADEVVFGKAALDANDFLILDGGKLFYDADGNGAGAAVQIANLKGVLTGISAANFADTDSLLV